ncbi:hypothetical protein PR202_gb12088 [Eleusine coracana subsp. coracana]|uniref:Fucosyltransferase n=1 Tax=Eleusine coracana subsp. coracana TaxID=191504 RepID=A0AAV5EP66_ELECO|nr:hypothetical protein PR202_gb12088 [Eleusine coracana subsp. coracana]
MSISGDEKGVPTFDDPAAEPWLATTGRRLLGRRENQRRRTVLIVVGGFSMVALPLLVFFLVGRDSASIAKLTAMFNGGITNYGNVTGGATTMPTAKKAADELLAGLLAPGMDRRSCRSRYESSQYYKHFPYKPSTYLLHKLRAYEARHKRCGPGTPLYAKAIERLRSDGDHRRRNDDNDCRYILWLPFDGLGNRMLSILSGFLYALLTDRVLLVALPNDSSDLFCEPFPDATWLITPEFPLSHLFNLGPHAHPDHAYTNLLKTKSIVLANNDTSTSPPPAYAYLSIGYDRGVMDAPFFCGGDHQRLLRNVTWLLLNSDLYFVPSMFPAFRAELRRMFPAMESVAHLLTRYLFHPTNPVWEMVTGFYLSHADKIIGMQIRMFFFATIPVDDMYNQILACSRQEHILPEITTTGTDIDIAGAGNLTVNNNNGSTAIFVASLYADYHERLKSRYSSEEHATINGGTVEVFQRTHEERQDTGSLEHNQKALAEIYLLSFSDELVTSGMSTFGYVSASLAGVRPAILLPAHGHKVPATPCVRAVSMEPCNLTPPLVECGGGPGGSKDDDDADVVRHVKVCEDFDRGVKLFD